MRKLLLAGVAFIGLVGVANADDKAAQLSEMSHCFAFRMWQQGQSDHYDSRWNRMLSIEADVFLDAALALGTEKQVKGHVEGFKSYVNVMNIGAPDKAFDSVEGLYKKKCADAIATLRRNNPLKGE